MFSVKMHKRQLWVCPTQHQRFACSTDFCIYCSSVSVRFIPTSKLKFQYKGPVEVLVLEDLLYQQ